MSLDVDLFNDDEFVYSFNITHNLNTMADKAGIYKHLWRPEEIGITKAGELIEPLSNGLIALVTNKADFIKYNPENGWGDYDGLVSVVADYLSACKQYPNATIRVDR